MASKSMSPFILTEIEYGRSETEWDLLPLLYKGGAGIDMRRATQAISTGALGQPLEERFQLVKSFYDSFAGDIAGGTSRHSIHTCFRILRRFFAWADHNDVSPTLTNVEQLYVQWTESLLERQRSTKPLKQKTIYAAASILARLIKNAFDLEVSPLYRTRIRRVSAGRDSLAHSSDKQNLEATFTFGNALLDICNCLSLEAVWGTFPIVIRFRDGRIIEDWCGLIPPELVKGLTHPDNPREKRDVERNRLAWEEDKTFRTRHAILNLRLEAEFMIFIAQTGMNITQALQLKIGKFRYQSYVNGYEVRRVFKNRRKGEVEFVVYSEYRPFFEKYLTWRNAIFPQDDDAFLFPFINPKGRSQDVAPGYSGLKKKCRELEIQFFRPRILRLTRINWLMRQTKNTALVAEMNQHSQETLLSSYSRPNHQIAVVEISRFFAQTDASLTAPGPGVCVQSNAEALSPSSESFPQPDCMSPAGCLNCKHYRDEDSADHMWSLASYRYLKSIELAKYRPSAMVRTYHPALAVIDRISQKLLDFQNSNDKRNAWVKEANARVEEGEYHPKWDGFIQLIEVQ